MILPDINLLVYAYNRGAPHHVRARKWWEVLLNGSEPVGEHQCELHSNDTDFARFPGLRWRDPL